MRAPSVIVAGLVFLLVPLLSAGLVTAEVKTMTAGGAAGSDAANPNNGGLLILRGSAVRRGVVTEPSYELDSDRWESFGGRRMWLVDRETGDVVSCRNRKTSYVGQRTIRCTRGTYSRYRRTFGRNFRH